MLSHIAKKILISPDQRSVGELESPESHLYFLAALHHAGQSGEVLIDWEDQYLLLELGDSVIHGAYAKADSFQFGKLLAEMTGAAQEDIDRAYQTAVPKGGETPEEGHRSPPSQRIGSLLVSAHVISPHMIGTVLRAQILERALRILTLESAHYTFEPKVAEVTQETPYPYLNPTVGLDEILFHALIWRSSMKVVNTLIEEISELNPTLQLPEEFRFPDHLAVVCRITPQELSQKWIGPLMDKEIHFAHWVKGGEGDQQAFHMRFSLAFLLVFANHWKMP